MKTTYDMYVGWSYQKDNETKYYGEKSTENE